MRIGAGGECVGNPEAVLIDFLAACGWWEAFLRSGTTLRCVPDLGDRRGVRRASRSVLLRFMFQVRRPVQPSQLREQFSGGAGIGVGQDSGDDLVQNVGGNSDIPLAGQLCRWGQRVEGNHMRRRRSS